MARLSKKQRQGILAAMLEEARKRTAQGLDLRQVLTIIPAHTSEEGQSMTSNDQEALYGPAGKADHQPGESITFASQDTGGKELTGEVLYVRAPGPAIVGGRSHPTTYIVFVEGEAFPRIVYIGDVIER